MLKNLFLLLSFFVQEARAASLTFVESEVLSPNIIRIPFRLTGTLITVQARVDGVEGNFFFDTGASGLVLNQRMFLNRLKNKTSGLSSMGSTGSVQVKGSTRIDSLSMDNLRSLNVPADIVDLSHLENSKKIALVGLIGYDVFKDFEILLDYSDQLVVLVRVNAKGAPVEGIPNWEYQALGEFPLIVKKHSALIQLQFNPKGKKVFALDSGAEQNLLSNFAGKGFLKRNFEIQSRIKLRGAGAQQVEVLSGSLLDAHLDTFNFAPMNTILTNLSEINSVFDADLDGVLGYEFFSQYTMSINYRKRQLRIFKKIIP